jgi:hypothetical protein
MLPSPQIPYHDQKQLLDGLSTLTDLQSLLLDMDFLSARLAFYWKPQLHPWMAEALELANEFTSYCPSLRRLSFTIPNTGAPNLRYPPPWHPCYARTVSGEWKWEGEGVLDTFSWREI